MTPLEKEIARLDVRIGKVTEQLTALQDERRALYEKVITEAADRLNDLKVKAGITKPQQWRRPHISNGTVNGRALTDDEVRDARKQHYSGVKMSHIAKQYNVSPLAIQKMLKGETYRDVV